MIEVGNMVRPIHNERSKYMNKDFIEWINKNKDNRFYVESVRGRCIRLSKVLFMITDEFLERI
jgi:hypothetical protein